LDIRIDISREIAFQENGTPYPKIKYSLRVYMKDMAMAKYMLTKKKKMKNQRK